MVSTPCKTPLCVHRANLVLLFVSLFEPPPPFACMETEPLHLFPLFLWAKKRNFGLVPFHTSTEIDALKSIVCKQMAKRCLFTWGQAGGRHSAQQNHAVALREAFQKVAFVRELSFL